MRVFGKKEKVLRKIIDDMANGTGVFKDFRESLNSVLDAIPAGSKINSCEYDENTGQITIDYDPPRKKRHV